MFNEISPKFHQNNEFHEDLNRICRSRFEIPTYPELSAVPAKLGPTHSRPYPLFS